MSEKEKKEKSKKDFERSVEVNHMIVLIRRYPEKAKEAVKKLTAPNNFSCKT